jgi:hypothetical protein
MVSEVVVHWTGMSEMLPPKKTLRAASTFPRGAILRTSSVPWGLLAIQLQAELQDKAQEGETDGLDISLPVCVTKISYHRSRLYV